MVACLRLVVVGSVLLAACSSSTTPPTDTKPAASVTSAAVQATTAPPTSAEPPTTNQELSTSTTTSTTTAAAPPATILSPSTVTEAEVHAALIDYLPTGLASTNHGGKVFCGHYLHGFEQDGDHVSAYITGSCLEYYVASGFVELGTGLGFYARVDMTLGAGGLYGYAHEQPDGEDAPDVFPDWVHDAMQDQRDRIVPEQPLLQAAAYFEATPERALTSGATCADISRGYSLYEYGVMYWLREGRPASLDVDNDGRPCEQDFASHLVDMYWEPMRFGMEPGLFCRDLDAKGLSIADAVAYWLREGRPARMDADGNGIPCETVFDRKDFAGFFATESGEASGQLCRDLAASGYRFSDALAYWFMEGAPDRMDADGNGVPCETVYDEMEILSYLWSASSELGPGLFCRDFARRGGFVSAVRYWMQQGMPERMDVDGNGIPCETVFDQFDIDRWIEFDRIWRVG